MKFKGDIIITDPCYIINDNNEDDWNKCDYGDDMSVLGINTYLSSSTEYGDWSCTTVKDDEKSKEVISKINELYFKFFNEYNSTTSEEERKILEENYTKEKELLKSDLILGNFCADAGLVGVFLLEEVLKYNPDFDYHINRPWTTTLIKDFDGDIEITYRTDEDGDSEVSVIGKGNINFYTTQTGF